MHISRPLHHNLKSLQEHCASDRASSTLLLQAHISYAHTDAFGSLAELQIDQIYICEICPQSGCGHCHRFLQISTDICSQAGPETSFFLERHGGRTATTFAQNQRRFVMDDRATVLYVDDNPKSSQLLAHVLEECGFRVIAKNDPAEALALCRRPGFDLALLDYEMPAITGAQLARSEEHTSE